MKIVIQGAGEVGSHLAKMLSLEANDITVIDDDPQRLANISSIADVIAIEGAPSSLRVMREADVQDADLFISVVTIFRSACSQIIPSHQIIDYSYIEIVKLRGLRQLSFDHFPVGWNLISYERII